MEEYKLALKISPSDTEFKNLLGNEEYNKLKVEVFERDGMKCRGCGFQHFDAATTLKLLYLHVESIDYENLKNSPCVTLCMACHTTQHIDVALNKGWVQLVNTSLKQKNLIEMCRINQTSSLNHDNLRFLRITPVDFIAKLKEGTLSPNSKAKVLFTNKFEWGDLV